MSNITLRVFGLLAGLSVLASPGYSAVTLQVGKNFTGATFGSDSSAQPPDGGLAVGPSHVVEFINGRYSVFAKLNPVRLQTKTDLAFWSSAGISVSSSFVSDPRIVFDNRSQRWFAAMIDVPSGMGANRFLLAVSASADPTSTWRGVAWTADPVNGYFADFPTLGIDADGVYLGGNLFDANGAATGMVLASIPRSDLLANPPSIAGLTSFAALDYATYGIVLQPAVTLGNASTTEAVISTGDLGLDFQPHSNLVMIAVQNAASPGGAVLGTPVSFEIPPYSVPINPPQPGGVDNLDDGDARLSATAYRVDDLLYTVHGTEINNRAAVQWFQINAVDQTLIQSGTIAHTNLHLFYPAIAANSNGTVVIAFNGCSSNSFISSYAVVGDPINGALSFGNLVLLKAGTVAYRTNTPTTTSRWGDYNAISPDPLDPARFWSLTSYPASSTAWSTQITELITGPLVLTSKTVGTNLQFSWSGSVAGYQLQTTSTLEPSNWLPVSQAATLTSGQYSVLIPAPATPAFFRLIK